MSYAVLIKRPSETVPLVSVVASIEAARLACGAVIADPSAMTAGQKVTYSTTGWAMFQAVTTFDGPNGTDDLVSSDGGNIGSSDGGVAVARVSP